MTFFFSSRRRHTMCALDWSSDVCSSDRGGDHRLDIGLGECVADGIGVVALVSAQRDDPLGQHPEQRPEAFHVVRLAGRQNEDRKSVASGQRVSVRVDLGGRRIIKHKNRKQNNGEELSKIKKKQYK